MKTITFRSITPVLRFEFEQDDIEFSHSGQFREAMYSIRMKKYERGTPDFEDLMKYAEPYYRLGVVPVYCDVPSTYGLVVDVSQPLTDELELCSDSPESTQITRTILTSLRLHASKGLQYDLTFLTRSPPHPVGGHTISRPASIQRSIPHLGYSSVLSASEFENCRLTFNALIESRWSNSTFLKVLSLALTYHRISFCLEAIEHSFLVLMIAFEALFKKKQGYESKASDLIAKLLAMKKSDRDRIYAEFSGKAKSTFYKFRNGIAHGNPKLDRRLVKSRYSDLYKYVTKALIRLISIPDGAFRPDKNYYEELSCHINDRFEDLPSS